MKLEKYINYSVEELVDNTPFGNWVLEGEHAPEWEQFVEDHPQFGETAEKARELLLLLKEDPGHMEEKDILGMWKNIERFNREEKKKIRDLRMRKLFFVAASVLLILSVGLLSYVFWGRESREYRFSFYGTDNQNNAARLILSDGEEIEMKKEHPVVSLNNNYELKINNDSVINLSKTETGVREKARMIEMIIPFGKRSDLILPDGSRVVLNAGTRLAFPARFDAKKREVFLSGEAYFEVAGNRKRPFIVHAGRLNIEVLGTHFNISAYSGDTNIETVLLEGEVSVYENKKLDLKKHKVVLKPYQKAEFNKENRIITVTNEQHADEYIAWTKGWFQFSDKNIRFVLRKVELYYNVSVLIDDNFHPTEKISGKLDINESLEDVMKILADVAGIRYRIEGKKVYIY